MQTNMREKSEQTLAQSKWINQQAWSNIKKQLVLQRQISLPGKKLLETVKNSRGRCKESTLNE